MPGLYSCLNGVQTTLPMIEQYQADPFFLSESLEQEARMCGEFAPFRVSRSTISWKSESGMPEVTLQSKFLVSP